MGARHNYAIAQILQDRGALIGLATDFAWLEAGRHVSFINTIARRLPAIDRRRIPHLSPDKVKAVWGTSLLNASSRWVGDMGNKLGEAWFDKRCGRSWLDLANILYSMFGNGCGYICRAKEQGLFIVSEIFITPVAHRIVSDEQRAFPAWDTPDPELSHEVIEKRVSQVIEQSDLLVCPSQTVVDGLQLYKGFRIERSAIIPYGHAARHETFGEPQPGRVLFAGSAILRKGIHYLAMAARILSERAPHIKILVAGQVHENVRSKPECRALTFLGQLGPREMAAEFSRADVFVLPTLAEGSASVINEALASGLPVVTTRAAGSIVRNEIEGFIVPERNAELIVEAVLRITLDRNLRANMSSHAKLAIAARSPKHWGNDLIHALTQVLT